MERLTITRCEVSRKKGAEPTDHKMEAMLNPASLSHSHSISYNPKAVQGQIAVASKFSNINAEKLSFELVFDGTGAVPGELVVVGEKIKELKKIVYAYNGEAHEPNVVYLTWGELGSFVGRMTSLDVDYTLFKPSGVPLRAKVKLQFVSFMTALEANLRAHRSSPDLTHEVLVRDGDTLPLLCHRIYGDSRHYLDVARANGLTTFRDLAPGTVLRFAPLT